MIKNFSPYLKQLENGKTYRAVAERLGVNISTIYRWARHSGKSPHWKQELIRERWAEKTIEVQKALCVVPNLRKVCREKKLSYFGFIAGSKFRAKKIGCYITARNICRVCGVDISNRPSHQWRRLCKVHDAMEAIRQAKLRVARGRGRVTRTTKYFHGNRR